MKKYLYLLLAAIALTLGACSSKPKTTFKGIDLTSPYSTIKMKLESCGSDFTITKNQWGDNNDGSCFNISLYDRDCECVAYEINDTLHMLNVCFPENNYDDEELTLLYQQIMSDLTERYGEAVPHTTYVGKDSEIAKSYERWGLTFTEYDYTEYIFNTRDGYISVQSRTSTNKSIYLCYVPLCHYNFNLNSLP